MAFVIKNFVILRILQYNRTSPRIKSFILKGNGGLVYWCQYNMEGLSYDVNFWPGNNQEPPEPSWRYKGYILLQFNINCMFHKCSCKTSEYLSKGCNADFELRGKRNACFYISTRLRAVSYFSLQSYCTRNPSTRAAINEGVSPRKKDKRLLTLLFCLGTTKLST